MTTRHPQRALRRHVEAGERRVAGRAKRACECRHDRCRRDERPLPRPASRKRRAEEAGTSPKPSRKRGAKTGDESDMQPRDGDEVARPRTPQKHAIGCADRFLRADRERKDDAPVRCRRKRVLYTRADRKAPAVDRRREACLRAAKPPRGRRRDDNTARAHATREKHRLRVGSAEIGIAMRSLQTDRELPRFAGHDLRHPAVGPLEPAQLNDGRKVRDAALAPRLIDID
jgi:hypothetical protein